jgi:hypothetical protein
MILRFVSLAYCIVLCVVGTLAGCGHPEPSTSSAPASGDTLVIRGGWLFDGVRDARVRNSGIVIREGRFAEVGADLVERDLAGADVLANYQDYYDVPAKDANGAALGVPHEQLFWRSGVAQSARVGDWKLNVSGNADQPMTADAA